MTDYAISRWKHSRFWAVKDADGNLVTVTVYKKGAVEVKRLLENKPEYTTPTPMSVHQVRRGSVVS